MPDSAITFPRNTSASSDTTDARYDMARALVKRRGLLATPRRKLVAALIVSLVAHLLLGSFAEVEPPDETFEPIKARFVNLPPPPLPVAAPVKKPAPKPKANTRPRAIVVAESPAAISMSDVVSIDPGPELVPMPGAIADATPTPDALAPVVIPDPVPEPAPVIPPQPPARMPPKKIELGYTAYLGEQKFEVGPVTLRFTHDAGRYKLRVAGRGRGIAALLYPGTFTGESEGQITSEGLRPDKFTEERGNPDKRRETIFDHEKNVLRVPDKEPIPFEGAPHDPLTWIVQFYFSTPKTEKFTISVGTSRRMDVYTLERAGEETIEVPTDDADPMTGKRALKQMPTQVWKATRKPDADGKPNGTATFWLSPEWHYVPFRLKVVNAQGRSASFELTAINAE